MKTPKAPTPPDPNVQAAAQTQYEKDTATYNNAITHGNTYTPLGNSIYTGRVDPVTGATVYDQTVTLDPAQQQLMDIQNQQELALGQTGNKMLGQIDSTLGTPLDTSGLPGLMGAVNFQQLQGLGNVGGPGIQGSVNLSDLGLDAGQVGTFANSGPGIQGQLDTSGLPQLYGANDLMGARNEVSDALYRQQAAYLDPQYQQREAQLQAELANKGISLGSEAYNNLTGNLARDRSFDYSRARDSAIAGSGSELSRLAQIAQGNRGQMFGERQASGQFQNNADAQAFAQDMARAGFGNDAALTNAQFRNSGLSANNQNALASGMFQNDAQSQYLADAMARAGFGNDAMQQNNANALMGAQFQNQARGQGLEEAYAARAEPLNMYSALRGATQVDVPQFQAAQNSVTNPADIAGYMGQNYQNQLQAYQQKLASRNAVLSGLFGLGSAAIGSNPIMGKILG